MLFQSGERCVDRTIELFYIIIYFTMQTCSYQHPTISRPQNKINHLNSVKGVGLHYIRFIILLAFLLTSKNHGIGVVVFVDLANERNPV